MKGGTGLLLGVPPAAVCHPVERSVSSSARGARSGGIQRALEDRVADARIPTAGGVARREGFRNQGLTEDRWAGYTAGYSLLAYTTKGTLFSRLTRVPGSFFVAIFTRSLSISDPAAVVN